MKSGVEVMPLFLLDYLLMQNWVFRLWSQPTLELFHRTCSLIMVLFGCVNPIKKKAHRQ